MQVLGFIGVIIAVMVGLFFLGLIIQYWFIVLATVIGTMLFGVKGGIICFIVALVIRNLIRSNQYKNAVDDQNTTYNHVNHQASQSEITIQSLIPVIGLISYFCLKKDNQWTSDKVKYVKGLFEDACETQADFQLLQQIMKEKSHADYQLIQQFLAMQPDYSLRYKVFVSCSTALLYDDFSDAGLDSVLTKLGQQLNLNTNDYREVIESLKTNAHQQQHSNNNTRHSTSQDQLAWAYNVLELNRQATEAEIKKAFRQKIAQYHPDKNQNVTEEVQQLLNEKTVDLQKARDIIMNSLISI